MNREKILRSFLASTLAGAMALTTPLGAFMAMDTAIVCAAEESGSEDSGSSDSQDSGDSDSGSADSGESESASSDDSSSGEESGPADDSSESSSDTGAGPSSSDSQAGPETDSSMESEKDESADVTYDFSEIISGSDEESDQGENPAVEAEVTEVPEATEESAEVEEVSEEAQKESDQAIEAYTQAAAEKEAAVSQAQEASDKAAAAVTEAEKNLEELSEDTENYEEIKAELEAALEEALAAKTAADAGLDEAISAKAAADAALAEAMKPAETLVVEEEKVPLAGIVELPFDEGLEAAVQALQDRIDALISIDDYLALEDAADQKAYFEEAQAIYNEIVDLYIENDDFDFEDLQIDRLQEILNAGITASYILEDIAAGDDIEITDYSQTAAGTQDSWTVQDEDGNVVEGVSVEVSADGTVTVSAAEDAEVGTYTIVHEYYADEDSQPDFAVFSADASAAVMVEKYEITVTTKSTLTFKAETVNAEEGQRLKLTGTSRIEGYKIALADFNSKDRGFKGNSECAMSTSWAVDDRGSSIIKIEGSDKNTETASFKVTGQGTTTVYYYLDYVFTDQNNTGKKYSTRLVYEYNIVVNPVINIVPDSLSMFGLPGENGDNKKIRDQHAIRLEYQLSDKLKAAVENDNNVSISLTSSDDDIVGIWDGMLYAKKAGQATITATVVGGEYNGMNDTCTVNVTNDRSKVVYIYVNRNDQAKACGFSTGNGANGDGGWSTVGYYVAGQNETITEEQNMSAVTDTIRYYIRNSVRHSSNSSVSTEKLIDYLDKYQLKVINNNTADSYKTGKGNFWHLDLYLKAAFKVEVEYTVNYIDADSPNKKVIKTSTESRRSGTEVSIAELAEAINGYTFDADNSANTADFTVDINDRNRVINLYYNRNTIEIKYFIANTSYSLEGLGDKETVLVKETDCIEALGDLGAKALEKEHYSFRGWYLADAEGNVIRDSNDHSIRITDQMILSDDLVRQNMTKDENGIYTSFYAMARWAKEKYDVTWMNGDETISTTKEVVYKTQAEFNGDEPEKEADDLYTYTFAGWSTDPNALAAEAKAVSELPVVTEATTYYAIFDKADRKYTVTYDLNGGYYKGGDNGKTKITDNVVYDENTYNASMPVFSEKIYKNSSDDIYTYTFAGWTVKDSNDGVVYKTAQLPANITSDVTYVAAYTKSVSIKLFQNLDKYDETPGADYVGKNYSKALATFTLSEDKVEADTSLKTALEACLTGKSISTSGDSEKINAITSALTNYGGSSVFESGDVDEWYVVKYFAEGDGWHIDGGSYNTYDVEFFDEDGKTSLGSVKMRYGQQITASDVLTAKKLPSKAADDYYTYDFAGWDRISTEEVEKYDVDNQTMPNVANDNETNKFKAVFAATPISTGYTVKYFFESDGGYVIDEEKTRVEKDVKAATTIKIGDVASLSTDRAGYTSTPATITYGKNMTSSQTGNKDTEITLTKDGCEICVYFDLADYSVTFKNYDGTQLSSKTDYHYNNDITAPDEPSKVVNDDIYHYVFSGWMDKDGNVYKTNELPKATADAEYTAVFDETIRIYFFKNYVDQDIKDGKVSVSGENYTPNWQAECITISGDQLTDEVKNAFTAYLGANGNYATSSDLKTISSIVSKISGVSDVAKNYGGVEQWYSIKHIAGDWFGDRWHIDGCNLKDYTVTFDPANGSESTSTPGIHYDGSVTAPAAPSKSVDDIYTYKFAGWQAVVNGQAQGDIIKAESEIKVTGDVTFEAVYDKSIDIHFFKNQNMKDTNGGQISAADGEGYDYLNIPISIKESAFDADNANFNKLTAALEELKAGNNTSENVKDATDALAALGYTVSADGVEMWYSAKYLSDFNGDRWHIDGCALNSYNVTFDPGNGGNAITNENVHMEGSISNRPDSDPVKKVSDDVYEYTFKGWKSSDESDEKLYQTSELPEVVSGSVTYTAVYDKSIAVTFFKKKEPADSLPSLAESSYDPGDFDTIISVKITDEDQMSALEKVLESNLNGTDDADAIANVISELSQVEKYDVAYKSQENKTVDEWYAIKYYAGEGWHIDGMDLNEYRISASVDPESETKGASVSIDNTISVDDNSYHLGDETSTVTITVNAGYYISGITIDGEAAEIPQLDANGMADITLAHDGDHEIIITTAPVPVRSSSSKKTVTPIKEEEVTIIEEEPTALAMTPDDISSDSDAAPDITKGGDNMEIVEELIPLAQAPEAEEAAAVSEETEEASDIAKTGDDMTAAGAAGLAGTGLLAAARSLFRRRRSDR